ncbi:hypothetical protein [Bradyrhizobium sp. HKCCYLS2038]|uniref:hypothetical protein n=1 Tax=Bradyrhizobium sp. HKCCYLS2038 TaxID=3420764 RepID=UPI003EBC74CF
MLITSSPHHTDEVVDLSIAVLVKIWNKNGLPRQHRAVTVERGVLISSLFTADWLCSELDKNRARGE